MIQIRFFNKVWRIACLKLLGTTPLIKELLIIAVRLELTVEKTSLKMTR